MLTYKYLKKYCDTISGLPNLRQLNLNSTKLSAETFDNLRQRLPQLQEYDIRYTEAWWQRADTEPSASNCGPKHRTNLSVQKTS